MYVFCCTFTLIVFMYNSLPIMSGSGRDFFNSAYFTGESAEAYSNDAAQSVLNHRLNESSLERAREWQKEMRDSSLTSAFNQAKSNGINPYAMFSTGQVVTPSSGGLSSSAGGSAGSVYSAFRSSKTSSENAIRNNLFGLVTTAVTAAASVGSALIKSGFHF